MLEVAHTRNSFTLDILTQKKKKKICYKFLALTFSCGFEQKMELILSAMFVISLTFGWQLLVQSACGILFDASIYCFTLGLYLIRKLLFDNITNHTMSYMFGVSPCPVSRTNSQSL